MTENFVTKIKINKSRNIKDFEINLSKDKKQHLILTGKNGSGKTSLLLELKTFFEIFLNSNSYDIYKIEALLESLLSDIKDNSSLESEPNIIDSIQHYKSQINDYGGTRVFFSTQNELIKRLFKEKRFIVTFFGAKRNSNMYNPSGIVKIDQNYGTHRIDPSSGDHFLQYIVNLKAERSFARDDNEMDNVERIDKWFNNFLLALRKLFNDDTLELKFLSKEYNFDIISKHNDKFSFSTLSDGYSSVLSIVSEIIMRMEDYSKGTYDLEGIVLIDEIETHLHVDLQKKILPFLSDFFPNIQFIVTTHSPFVLSSVSNATICDLEKKVVTNDLSGYSYDALLESYFDTDKYSELFKVKMNRFEELLEVQEKNVDELLEVKELESFFNSIPKYFSLEFDSQLTKIKLDKILKKISNQ